MVQLIIFLLVIATAAASTVGGAFSSVTTTTAGVGRRVEAGAELLAVAQKIELSLSAGGLQATPQSRSLSDLAQIRAATMSGRSSANANATAAFVAGQVSPLTGGGTSTSAIGGPALPVIDMAFDASAYPWTRVLGGACELMTPGAGNGSKCTGGLMIVVPKQPLNAVEARALESALGRLRAAGIRCSTELAQTLGVSTGPLWSVSVVLPANNALACKVGT